jgi:hypothetical protein
MLEGLARNWGIYLSCAVDLTELGSCDLQGNSPGFTAELPQADAPDYQTLLNRNCVIVG